MHLPMLLLLAAAPHAAPALHWADVEPAVRTCFSIVKTDQGFALAPEGGDFARGAKGLTGTARTAVTEGCADAMTRVAFSVSDAQDAALEAAKTGGEKAGSAKFREVLFQRPHALRVFRKAVAASLKGSGIACADCDAPDMPARAVTFAEMQPYLVRLCFVSVDDLPGPLAPQGGFHVCTGTNDLRGLPSVDPLLAEVAYAALLASFEDDQAIAGVKAHVQEACKGEAPPADKAMLERINARLQASLAADADLMSRWQRSIAAEAHYSDVACADCAAR